MVDHMKIRVLPAVSIAAFALVACSADVDIAVESVEAEAQADELAEEPAEEASTSSDTDAESEAETTGAVTAEGADGDADPPSDGCGEGGCARTPRNPWSRCRRWKW